MIEPVHLYGDRSCLPLRDSSGLTPDSLSRQRAETSTLTHKLQSQFTQGSFRLVSLPMRVGIYLSLLCMTLAGCARPAGPPASSTQAGCIENYNARTDYFPEKTHLEYAENFAVEYHNSYKVVTVRPPANGGGKERYVLVQCGAPSPVLSGDLSKATVISVPIKSLFAAYATHAALLFELGHVEVLSGVAQTRYITTEPILEWIRGGHVIEYAPNDVTDTELVILKAPSILMSGGEFPESYNTLRKAGVAVVANLEWQEPSALARAEWLKFMALFLNEEKKAREQFDGIRNRYLTLKEGASNIAEKDRPRVMTGTVFRGIFEIAGGASYVARLISDAGGTYVWADNTSAGGASIDMELQISRASNADVWINGGDWASLKAMLAEDPRYKQFKPFQNGNA